MRPIVTTFSLLLLAIVALAPATVHHVPAQFAKIQLAIDYAFRGDTILVDQGRYLENIHFTGKNLTLASRFIMDSDPGHIQKTIIDGDNNGSTVSFLQGENSTCRLIGFTITGGLAASGGGIRCENSGPSLSHLIITNNTAKTWIFDFEIDGAGGGLFCLNSTAVLTNVLFYGNHGLPTTVNIEDSSKVTLTHVTIVEKNAIAVFQNSQITITNSIIWGDTPIAFLESGCELSIQHSDIRGGYTGNGIIAVPPRFYDTSNDDYRLSDFSPCIGSGNSQSTVAVDLLGNPRPLPAGTPPDMGAFENRRSVPLSGPGMAFTIDTLDFGEAFVGDTVKKSLRVLNNGSMDLLISSITTNHPDFRVSPNFAGIDPDDDDVISIIFIPTSETSYRQQLIILSNSISDDTTKIPINGIGLLPPVLALSDDTLLVVVERGTAVTQQLIIHNNGKSDLRLNIAGGGSSTNSALQFTGSTSYVECQNTPSLNITESLTFEAWIYPFDWNGNRRILQKGGNDNQYSFYVQEGFFTFDVLGVQNGWVQTPLPSTNQWHHCAGVYNYTTGTIQLYINGVKMVEKSGVSGQINTTCDKLYLGTKLPGAWEGDFFHGIIDEVRLWNIVRDSASIRKFMNVPLEGTEPGLMAYWQFDEGTGDITRDKTLNSNHGTLFGTPTWTENSPPMVPGWLTLSANSGTIAPGASIQIDCKFDAAEKDTGLYIASIIVQSNDPQRKSIVLPVRMKVTYTTDVNSTPSIPLEFALSQNYPNPFNPSTTIRYALPEKSNVRLKIYDVLGREVITLVNQEQSAGWKEIVWNAENQSSGIYLYTLEAGNYVATKKMLVIK